MHDELIADEDLLTDCRFEGLIVALDADLKFWVSCSPFGFYLGFGCFDGPGTPYLRLYGPYTSLMP